MRFIVDFYRYAIFAVLALVIAGIAFLTLSVSSNPDFNDASVLSVIVIGAGVLGCLGISLGLVATFISIHDRHIELVEEVKLIREAIQQRGGE